MSRAIEHRTDIAAARQAHLLAALLDHDTPPWPAGELPPLAHWLLFPPDARQSCIGPDGHPMREDDGLPRRMWAGSRVRFLAPILLGSEVERETSAIAINACLSAVVASSDTPLTRMWFGSRGCSTGCTMIPRSDNRGRKNAEVPRSNRASRQPMRSEPLRPKRSWRKTIRLASG